LVERLERIFFALGFALLAVWGASELDRAVISRAAIAKFDSPNTTEVISGVQTPDDLTSGSEINFALWALDRVRAYKASLLRHVDTPVAVLRIPKIHLEVPVFNGTGHLTLNRGVGRMIGTSQVGAGGNLGIAGHRDGFFRGLKDVAPGDVIELAHPGQTDFYVVDWIQITNPDDLSVLKPTTAPSLTLVTCFPFHVVGSAPERYVVRASRRNFAGSKGGSSENPNSTANQTNKKENVK
jgi:sortase A